MKVITFTIPVRQDRTVIVQREKAPQFYPHLHRHEELQLTWVQQGAGTLVTGEQLHNFQAGEVFLFSANLPHLFKNENPAPAGIAALSLFFKVDHPLWALPELQQVQQFLRQIQGAFRVESDQVVTVQQALEQLARRPHNMRLAPFIELMQQLLQSAALERIGEPASAAVSEREGLRMNTILQYAMQHYQRSVSLEEIARQVHMVPGSFCRFFKQHTGKTFIVFLNEIRIREACRQLTTQPDRQIAEVAFQCGFKNVSSFNRVFRQLRQQSPTAYLQSLQLLM